MSKDADERSRMRREIEDLRREVAYLRRMAERTIGKMLQLDAESVAIRHELEQKRRGFGLMAELAGTLGKDVDHDGLFVSISRRLNATLGMQRTAVLMPVAGGLFRPAVLQGYPPGEEAAVGQRTVLLDREFLDPDAPVLITGADPRERFAALREALELPFLISSPVILDNEVAAVLITGRMLEQQPYLPPLGRSDVESVRTVGSHLATLLAGRRLVEAEQRTQIMVDAMPLCCNFWDENYRNIDCNQEAVRLFELSNKQEYLENFYKLSPRYQPGGRLSSELAEEKVREAFATGHSRFEWMHQKLSGELLPAEITLVRVKRAERCIVVGYTRDMREQKAMLGAMHRTQDELRFARDLAEKNARAKSEFLANMSHEIRTPMNAILGMAHLLGRTELTEKQSGYLDRAEHSANLLLRIINDILDFAKLDSGKMAVDAVVFSLRKLMRNVHDAIREEAGGKSIRPYTSVDDQAPDALLGDPLRIEQILLNLAGNAVKFTPPGGRIVLRVLLRAMLADAATLTFEVEDTGIGMDAEQAATLFLPFSQGDSSATRRYGGTGLGLAISARLAAIMGGELSCASEPGKGTVFSLTLTLPLAGETSPALGAGAAPLPDIAGPLSGLRVLLAEDNAINQMIAEELLSAKGVRVTTVGNGREALDALEKDSFDLILMDIQMPEMDGLTATACIRARPECRGLPIIAMTAHAMSGDRERSLESGMNDHITKPIDPDVLYAVLERWRGKPPPARET